MRPADHERQCPLVQLITRLEPAGWHVVEIRPDSTDGETALWRVKIERYDRSASMTVIDAYPDVALAELARYAQADAQGAAGPTDCATALVPRRANHGR